MYTAFIPFETGISTVSKHLLSIFPGAKLRNLTIHVQVIQSISRFFQIPEFRNFEKITVDGNMKLLKKDVETLIDSGAETLDFRSFPGPEHTDEVKNRFWKKKKKIINIFFQIFKVKNLVTDYGFQSSEMYLKLKCAHLTIYHTRKLNPADFNAILRSWQAESEKSIIEHWQLHGVFKKPRKTENQQNLVRPVIEEIFEGIERMEWSPERRARYFRYDSDKVGGASKKLSTAKLWEIL